jgi:uncharacterized membrane protein HdeD (DUF308 family)
VASLVVGLAFVVWPGATLGAMVLLTGISALVIGGVEIAFAFLVRLRVPPSRPRSGTRPTRPA